MSRKFTFQQAAQDFKSLDLHTNMLDISRVYQAKEWGGGNLGGGGWKREFRVPRNSFFSSATGGALSPNFISWKSHWQVSAKYYQTGMANKRQQKGSVMENNECQ